MTRTGIVCGLLFFSACGSAESPVAAGVQSESGHKSVWDNRSPDVIRAEAVIRGTKEYTIRYMKTWLDRFKGRYENDPVLGKDVREFERKLALVVEQDEKLLRMFKDDTTEGHSEIKKLMALIQEANEPMFRLMRATTERYGPSSHK